MAVAADTAPTTRAPATQRSVTVDLATWQALVEFFHSRGIRVIQVPCGPWQMPRYRVAGGTTAVTNAGLSERQLEVLQRMADGQKNSEIGRGMYLSEDTIKTYARQMFRALGAKDRTHAVAIGYRRGILGGAA